MDIKHIIDTFHFELLLESLGILFGLGMLWYLFFQQGISMLFTLFITTIC